MSDDAGEEVESAKQKVISLFTREAYQAEPEEISAEEIDANATAVFERSCGLIAQGQCAGAISITFEKSEGTPIIDLAIPAFGRKDTSIMAMIGALSLARDVLTGLVAGDMDYEDDDDADE